MRKILTRVATSFPYRKAVAALAALALVSSSVLTSVAEANFWQDRRKAVETRNAPASSDGRMAGLPAGDLLPAIQNVTAGLPQAMVVTQGLTGDPEIKNAISRLPSALTTLPTAYGEIRGVHLSADKNAPLVLLIQDVHGVLSAQENIANVLDHVSKRSAAPVLVGLEGARGPLDIPLYRSLDDKKARNVVAEMLFNASVLTGAEYFGITSDKEERFLGLEDVEPYRRNVDAYRKSVPLLEESRTSFGRLAGALQKTKDALFPDGLKALDAQLEKFHRGEESLTALVSLLSPGGEAPNIARFQQAAAMEKSLDFKEVESERARLVRVLAERLAKSDMEALIAMSLSYKAGQVSHGGYYRYLRDLFSAKGISLASYPSFESYIRYVLLSDRIDAARLFEEIESAEDATAAKLASSPEVRRAFAQGRDLRLLDKLLRHELTSAEWTRYQSRRSGILSLFKDLTGSEDARFKEMLPIFEDFYTAAHERNQALSGNLLNEWKSLPQRPAMAVLVAGGFHTPGLEEELARRGASTVTVTPRIGEISGKPSDYLQVFTQRETPLEKMLLGEKLMVNPLLGTSKDASLDLKRVTAVETVRQATVIAYPPVVNAVAAVNGASDEEASTRAESAAAQVTGLLDSKVTFAKIAAAHVTYRSYPFLESLPGGISLKILVTDMSSGSDRGASSGSDSGDSGIPPAKVRESTLREIGEGETQTISAKPTFEAPKNHFTLDVIPVRPALLKRVFSRLAALFGSRVEKAAPTPARAGAAPATQPTIADVLSDIGERFDIAQVEDILPGTVSGHYRIQALLHEGDGYRRVVLFATLTGADAGQARAVHEAAVKQELPRRIGVAPLTFTGRNSIVTISERPMGAQDLKTTAAEIAEANVRSAVQLTVDPSHGLEGTLSAMKIFREGRPDVKMTLAQALEDVRREYNVVDVKEVLPGSVLGHYRFRAVVRDVNGNEKPAVFFVTMMTKGDAWWEKNFHERAVKVMPTLFAGKPSTIAGKHSLITISSDNVTPNGAVAAELAAAAERTWDWLSELVSGETSAPRVPVRAVKAKEPLFGISSLGKTRAGQWAARLALVSVTSQPLTYAVAGVAAVAAAACSPENKASGSFTMQVQVVDYDGTAPTEIHNLQGLSGVSGNDKTFGAGVRMTEGDKHDGRRTAQVKVLGTEAFGAVGFFADVNNEDLSKGVKFHLFIDSPRTETVTLEAWDRADTPSRAEVHIPGGRWVTVKVTGVNDPAFDSTRFDSFKILQEGTADMKIDGAGVDKFFNDGGVVGQDFLVADGAAVSNADQAYNNANVTLTSVTGTNGDVTRSYSVGAARADRQFGGRFNDRQDKTVPMGVQVKVGAGVQVHGGKVRVLDLVDGQWEAAEMPIPVDWLPAGTAGGTFSMGIDGAKALGINRVSGLEVVLDTEGSGEIDVTGIAKKTAGQSVVGQDFLTVDGAIASNLDTSYHSPTVTLESVTASGGQVVRKYSVGGGQNEATIGGTFLSQQGLDVPMGFKVEAGAGVSILGARVRVLDNVDGQFQAAEQDVTVDQLADGSFQVSMDGTKAKGVGGVDGFEVVLETEGAGEITVTGMGKQAAPDTVIGQDFLTVGGAPVSNLDTTYHDFTSTLKSISEANGNVTRTYDVDAARAKRKFGGLFNQDQALNTPLGVGVAVTGNVAIRGARVRVTQTVDGETQAAEQDLPVSELADGSFQVSVDATKAKGVSGVGGMELVLDTEGGGTVKVTGLGKKAAAQTTVGQAFLVADGAPVSNLDTSYHDFTATLTSVAEANGNVTRTYRVLDAARGEKKFGGLFSQEQPLSVALGFGVKANMVVHGARVRILQVVDGEVQAAEMEVPASELADGTFQEKVDATLAKGIGGVIGLEVVLDTEGAGNIQVTGLGKKAAAQTAAGQDFLTVGGAPVSNMDQSYHDFTATLTGVTESAGNVTRTYSVGAARGEKKFGGLFNQEQPLSVGLGVGVSVTGNVVVHGAKVRITQVVDGENQAAEEDVPVAELADGSFQVSVDATKALGVSGVKGMEVVLDTEGTGTVRVTGFGKKAAAQTAVGQDFLTVGGAPVSNMDQSYHDFTATLTSVTESGGNVTRTYSVGAARGEKKFGGLFSQQQALSVPLGAGVSVTGNVVIHGAKVRITQVVDGEDQAAEEDVPVTELADGSFQVSVDATKALGVSGVKGMELVLDTEGSGTILVTGLGKKAAAQTAVGQDFLTVGGAAVSTLDTSYHSFTATLTGVTASAGNVTRTYSVAAARSEKTFGGQFLVDQPLSVGMGAGVSVTGNVVIHGARVRVLQLVDGEWQAAEEEVPVTELADGSFQVAIDGSRAQGVSGVRAVELVLDTEGSGTILVTGLGKQAAAQTAIGQNFLTVGGAPVSNLDSSYHNLNATLTGVTESNGNVVRTFTMGAELSDKQFGGLFNADQPLSTSLGVSVSVTGSVVIHGARARVLQLVDGEWQAAEQDVAVSELADGSFQVSVNGAQAKGISAIRGFEIVLNTEGTGTATVTGLGKRQASEVTPPTTPPAGNGNLATIETMPNGTVLTALGDATVGLGDGVTLVSASGDAVTLRFDGNPVNFGGNDKRAVAVPMTPANFLTYINGNQSIKESASVPVGVSFAPAFTVEVRGVLSDGTVVQMGAIPLNAVPGSNTPYLLTEFPAAVNNVFQNFPTAPVFGSPGARYWTNVYLVVSAQVPFNASLQWTLAGPFTNATAATDVPAGVYQAVIGKVRNMWLMALATGGIFFLGAILAHMAPATAALLSGAVLLGGRVAAIPMYFRGHEFYHQVAEGFATRQWSRVVFRVGPHTGWSALWRFLISASSDKVVLTVPHVGHERTSSRWASVFGTVLSIATPLALVHFLAGPMALTWPWLTALGLSAAALSTIPSLGEDVFPSTSAKPQPEAADALPLARRVLDNLSPEITGQDRMTLTETANIIDWKTSEVFRRLREGAATKENEVPQDLMQKLITQMDLRLLAREQIPAAGMDQFLKDNAGNLVVDLLARRQDALVEGKRVVVRAIDDAIEALAPGFIGSLKENREQRDTALHVALMRANADHIHETQRAVVDLRGLQVNQVNSGFLHWIAASMADGKPVMVLADTPAVTSALRKALDADSSPALQPLKEILSKGPNSPVTMIDMQALQRLAAAKKFDEAIMEPGGKLRPAAWELMTPEGKLHLASVFRTLGHGWEKDVFAREQIPTRVASLAPDTIDYSGLSIVDRLELTIGGLPLKFLGDKVDEQRRLEALKHYIAEFA